MKYYRKRQIVKTHGQIARFKEILPGVMGYNTGGIVELRERAYFSLSDNCAKFPKGIYKRYKPKAKCRRRHEKTP